MMIDIDVDAMDGEVPYPLPPTRLSLALGWVDDGFAGLGQPQFYPEGVGPTWEEMQAQVQEYIAEHPAAFKTSRTVIPRVRADYSFDDGFGDLGDALSDCYGACAAQSEGADPELIQACYSTCGSIYTATPQGPALPATGAKPTVCGWYQSLNTATKQCELGGPMLIGAMVLGGVFLFTFGGGR